MLMLTGAFSTTSARRALQTVTRRAAVVAQVAAMALLAGCQQDDPSPVFVCGDVPPTTVHELLRRYAAPTQVFTLDPHRREVFETANGATIDIPADGFTYANGQPVTSPITLYVRDIYTAGDMLLSEVPTVTGGRLLQSAGSFYLKAFSGNQTLRLNGQDTIFISPPLDAEHFRFNGILSSVQQWTGKYVGTDSTDWSADPTGMSIGFVDPAGNANASGGGNSTALLTKWVANMRRDTLGWLGTGAFIYPSRTITTAVEVGTDYLNTRVFVVAKGLNGVFEPAWNRQTAQLELANVPINTQLTAVVIRVKDGHFFFGTDSNSARDGLILRPQLRELTEAQVIENIHNL